MTEVTRSGAAAPDHQEVSNMGPGNGGHNKNCPRWSLLKDPNRRGHLPKLLQSALDSLFSYYHDPESLPALAHLNSTTTNQDGKRRKNRSEAREAECLVMAAIVHFTDLTTLRLGTPIKGTGECIYRSTKELAELAGLLHPTTGKPLRKFTRAFVRLQQVGFLSTKVVATSNKKGEIRRRNSAKAITETMLIALLGGDEYARKAVKSAREKHSKATISRRAKTFDQRREQERQNFHREVIEKAQELQLERDLDKAMAKIGYVDTLSPMAREAAYRKARQEHQNRLLSSGYGFAELHAQMKQFPTLEEWKP